jgi:chromosome segregation ATPase
MLYKQLTFCLVILLTSLGINRAQGLAADDGMLNLDDMPAFRKAAPVRASPTDEASSANATEVDQSLQSHLEMLYQQIEQLTFLQDQLDDEFLRLTRLRKVSLDEAETLEQLAEASPNQDPSEVPAYRSEILLLEQQAIQCERQIRQNETQRRLQQQMVEDLQAQIDQHEEVQDMWQEIQETTTETTAANP